MAAASASNSTLVMTWTFQHNKTVTLVTLENSTMAAPSLSPEERVQIARYNATFNFINHSYMWIIFALGFPGNLFSLLVILGMRWWGSPAVFMATLAVVDNLAIVVKLMLVQFGQHKAAIGPIGCKIMFFLGNHLYYFYGLVSVQAAIGPIGCKIMFFLGNHLVVYANWVLVAMAVERFFAVWQPLRVSQMWTPRKAALSLAVLLLVTVTLTAPLFLTVTVKGEDGAHICGIDSAYGSFMRVWQMGQVIAYGFLPCLFLLTINILIIILISRAHRLHRSLTSSMTQSNAATRKSSTSCIQRQATIMLVVTSSVLVLTTTPICVYMLLHKRWEVERGTVEFAKKEFIKFMLRVICDSNHSVNFYLYFVSARNFRSYFCKAMCFVCSRYMTRPGSEVTSQHFHALRSTIRVKGTGSEGHTTVIERKLVDEEEENREHGGMQLMLYKEKGQDEPDTNACGSLL